MWVWHVTAGADVAPGIEATRSPACRGEGREAVGCGRDTVGKTVPRGPAAGPGNLVVDSQMAHPNMLLSTLSNPPQDDTFETTRYICQQKGMEVRKTRKNETLPIVNREMVGNILDASNKPRDRRKADPLHVRSPLETKRDHALEMRRLKLKEDRETENLRAEYMLKHSVSRQRKAEEAQKTRVETDTKRERQRQQQDKEAQAERRLADKWFVKCEREAREQKQREVQTRKDAAAAIRGDLQLREAWRKQASDQRIHDERQSWQHDLENFRTEYMQWHDLKRQKQAEEAKQRDTELSAKVNRTVLVQREEIEKEKREVRHLLKIARQRDLDRRRQKEAAREVGRDVEGQIAEKRERDAKQKQRDFSVPTPPAIGPVPGLADTQHLRSGMNRYRAIPRRESPPANGYHPPAKYHDHRGKLLFGWGLAG
ncbi:hypothetical protein DIPPA_20148 [Diplonema papillatum]|nr:hypothetical protein DIPPA_20148 [Diplonema papillatum]